MCDVIVVGAGHNGLTCAGYLAKAGKRVLVLEAREVVGGLAWTREMPNAPGYKVNPCSVEFLLTGVEPSVDHELGLAKHGLEWVYPDTLLTWLGPDGQVMPIWKDRNRLVDEIKRYSQKDARRYGELCDAITTTLKVALPYLQGHPIRVRPSVLAEMLAKAAKGRNESARGARAMLGSIEQVCEEYFDRDEIKVPVATYSLGQLRPDLGSGYRPAPFVDRGTARMGCASPGRRYRRLHPGVGALRGSTCWNDHDQRQGQGDTHRQG